MTGRALALALHHLRTGRPEGALAALGQLPADDAVTLDALLVRGRALLGLDRDEEARQVAQRALAADGDEPDAWWLMADASRALGQLAGAEHALLAALRLQPGSAPLMLDHAKVLAEAGQGDKAQRVLERAAALEPGSPGVAETRTYLAFARGDDAAAARLARAALAQSPDSVHAQAMVGATSLLRGDGPTAWRASRRAAGSAVGDRRLADLAREARLQAHPSMAGLRLVTRFGVVRVWLVGVVLLVLSVVLLPPAAGAVVAVAWLVFCLYTWTGGALLRTWARWRW